ncbi:MAG TPA: nitroreductase family deazaflavin-dependent oxidoreductase [Actinomycetota bacterium]|nr:nitroreductase family deazaflavin-dependent oxidoreductase [Actinomycetota bacterium]
MTDGRPLSDLDYCYLTTTGRRSGEPHRIEIWFALVDGVVYLLSGGGDRSDWVRNLEISPDVVLEIGGEKRTTTARLVADRDEDELARRVIVEKYRPRYRGDLDDWGKTSLPVAIDWG